MTPNPMPKQNNESMKSKLRKPKASYRQWLRYLERYLNPIKK